MTQGTPTIRQQPLVNLDCLENHLKEDVLTHTAQIDLDKLREFVGKHAKCLNKCCPDPIFKPAFTFSYTPSNIGVCVNVTCYCKAEKDISDYSRF